MAPSQISYVQYRHKQQFAFHFARLFVIKSVLLRTTKSNRNLLLHWICLTQIGAPPIKFLNFQRAPPSNDVPLE